MQTEIESAASFWLKYIPDGTLTGDKKEALRQALVSVLTDKYTGHWHPERTTQGSGFRSVSNWRRLDSVFVEAGDEAGVPLAVLERLLPRDVVVWCDPYNVTYRVGDHGTVYTIYEDKRLLIDSMKKTMAERASKSSGDFVISAYTTPVVIRSADGVEVARRGGQSPGKDIRRTNAMSPLRQVTYQEMAAPVAGNGKAAGGSSSSTSPPSLVSSRWSPALSGRLNASGEERSSSTELSTPPPQFGLLADSQQKLKPNGVGASAQVSLAH